MQISRTQDRFTTHRLIREKWRVLTAKEQDLTGTWKTESGTPVDVEILSQLMRQDFTEFMIRPTGSSEWSGPASPTYAEVQEAIASRNVRNPCQSFSNTETESEENGLKLVVYNVCSLRSKVADNRFF
ncbi:hypothetical protein J6590_104275 [Homalodisca vitripennis]|nr:hypothetical protein J6590_104275 [Homalodisca vitripennis]